MGVLGFSGGSEGKASACNAGDLGLIPGQEDPLEKETAPHSSTLAWKIPWTEKSGRLQSMGSQRVGHDCLKLFLVKKYTAALYIKNMSCSKIYSRKQGFFEKK